MASCHAATRGVGARTNGIKFTRFGALEQLEARCLLSRSGPGIWFIAGDQNPQDLNDHIVIERDPARPEHLRATVNGVVLGSRPERQVRGIRIVAGDGSDVVRIDETAGRILVPATILGGAGSDHLTGASGPDLIDGGADADTVIGAAGDDRLTGGTGPNRLEGGAGSDNLRGGPENDTMWGGDGNDRIDGMGGRDRIYGGEGRDSLNGGLDDDTLIGHGEDPGGNATAPSARAAGRRGGSNDRLDGGPGDNVLVGSNARDVLRNGRAPESLHAVSSCADAAARLAELAEQQFAWYLKPNWGLGRPGGLVTLDSNRLQDLASGLTGGSSGNGATFSNTNTQEQGVDEPDIVKTDGNHIFVLREQEFIVLDAVPGDETQVVSRTEVEGFPVDLFLHGSRAMIFSTVYDDVIEPLPGPIFTLRSLLPIWPGRPQLKLTVFDLSDPVNPSLVHESLLDGSYINSRLVDGKVFIVLGSSPRWPTPRIMATDDGQAVESAEVFKKRLESTAPESFLPQYHSIDYTDSGTVEETGSLLVDCGDVYKTPVDDWMNLTTVLSYDLNAPQIGGPLDSATVFGHVSTVYASTQNMYLISPVWKSTSSLTGIHKLTLGDDIQLAASGEVPGNVLNQFSLDEQGDYFRVATTTRTWGPGGGRSENNVYILSAQGDSLNVVGSIEGLAPDETIFAARFFEDEGFVVTFRQVDPLFALDLSDPTHPKVAGELHIPGFSRYLHPAGDDHLLAIGRDTDDNGRMRGLQVSLFDVSDLSNPTRVDQFLIQPEGGWSWSAAEWDHHAFSYFPEFGVMVVPIEGSVLVAAVDDGDPDTFDGPTWVHTSNFWVFQVDVLSGFELIGTVSHDSTALRSLRIGDLLYTLAYDDIKVQPIVDPVSTTAQVALD